MRDLPVCVLLLSALFAVVLRSAPQQPDAPPTFRSDARLVRVSVVVHDQRGRPVQGLTARDFEVFEDRKPAPVALFYSEGRAAAADTPRTQPAPDLFTNRVEGPAASGVTLILYDLLNTAWTEQRQAKDHVVKFLKQLRPTDQVGFYLMDDEGIRVLHDFSRDVSSLIEALGGAVRPTSIDLAASQDRLANERSTGDADLDRLIKRADEHTQGFFLDRRVNSSIAAIESLGSALAGVRGRKNIIWISSLFPTVFNDGIGRQNLSSDVRRATKALNDSDIALYPVDARGLLVHPMGMRASAKSRPIATLDDVWRHGETAMLLAEQTGGRAFLNTNGLSDAMARAAEDSRLTYVLGYYPLPGPWDGRFRDIKIRVRRPGVQVRHRLGYYAVPAAAPGPADRDKILADALGSPLDSTAIGISVAVERAQAADEIFLRIVVEGESLRLAPEGDALAGSLDVAIAQGLPDGRLIRSVDAVVSLRVKLSEREQLLTRGVTLTRTLKLQPDAHQIKIAIGDRSGRLGTVTIPASSLRPGDISK